MDASYKYGDIELCYSVEGEGDTIILMHGWGCDRTIWTNTVQQLKSNYRVVTIDFAGFGRSDEPTTVWGVEEYTRSIEALVAHLGVERPSFVAHSFGGRVAIVYASRNAVDKLVFADVAGVKPRRTWRYYYKVYSFKAMRYALPLLIGKRKAQMLVEQRRAAAGSSDYNSATPMMRAILSKCVNEDLCHLMPKVKASVLLFWGDKDTATPISDARKMERLMPNAGLVIAEGAGHYAMLEQPQLWQASLKSFLKLD